VLTLRSALRGAAACLKNQDASAEDAVVAALTVLEHNRRFNCGIGSMPTLGGQIEQDALIIDRHGRSGAIAAAPCKPALFIEDT
jgi:taspase, threonine aspartase, 1